MTPKNGVDGEVEQHEKSAKHTGVQTGEAAVLEMARKQMDLQVTD